MAQSPPNQGGEQAPQPPEEDDEKADTRPAAPTQPALPSQYDRVGSDQMRALLAGGMVASGFVYLAFRLQLEAFGQRTNATNSTNIVVSPPFAFPGHDPLLLGTILVWIFAIVAILLSTYLVLLSVSYSMDNPDFGGKRWVDHPGWATHFRLQADRFFSFGSWSAFALGIVVVARVVEYFSLGGAT